MWALGPAVRARGSVAELCSGLRTTVGVKEKATFGRSRDFRSKVQKILRSQHWWCVEVEEYVPITEFRVVCR